MTGRVAILISGGGSNMVELVRDMAGDHPARACLVVSNEPDAAGLKKARALGVATALVAHRRFGRDRAGFEAELNAALEPARPDLICLAGFMRILTPAFVGRWSDRLINIHPSLLPKFTGLNTHARAIAAAETRHGCTVHRVTGDLDDGPILGQARLEMRAGETSKALAGRVLALEHKLYPAVVRALFAGEGLPVRL